MKKYTLLFLLFILSYPSFAQKKLKYGVGIDVFQTKIHNVDRTQYSNPFEFPKQNDRLGFGINFLMTKPIDKRFALETGVGIVNYRSQFQFAYFDSSYMKEMRDNLNISLYYFKLPFFVTYQQPLNVESALTFSAGINVRVLFWRYDNYNEIIKSSILLPKGRYNFIIVSPQAALGYNFRLKNKNTFRAEANVGVDLQKFTFGGDDSLLGWGFYKRLSKAYYSNYGISLKYFFAQK